MSPVPHGRRRGKYGVPGPAPDPSSATLGDKAPDLARMARRLLCYVFGLKFRGAGGDGGGSGSGGGGGGNDDRGRGVWRR